MRPVPERLKRKFFCLRGVHAPNCCSLLWPKHTVLVLRHDLLLIPMLLFDRSYCWLERRVHAPCFTSRIRHLHHFMACLPLAAAKKQPIVMVDA
jgi:hypothetical protein